MVRIRQEYDDARQTAMARELHRLIAHDQPYTFLYVRRVALAAGRQDRPRGPGAGREAPRTCRSSRTGSGRIDFHFNQWLKTPAPGPAALSAPS